MKEEIWKDIKGLEGIYQESNLDNVRSVKYMKKLKPSSEGVYVIYMNGKKTKYKPNHEAIQDYDGELWVEIEGYNGKYWVSNHGRVKMVEMQFFNKPFRLMKPQTAKGYKCIRLYNSKGWKDYLVHRLVADYFIPNPNNFPHVNHKDENPSNNMADNLEWCTRLYNVRYGTAIERKKEKLKKYKKPVEQYSKDGVFIKRWDSATDAANELGLYSHCICQVAKGINKTHGGYVWKYA